MTVILKSPETRALGPRTLKVSEDQANILRKVGWTDIIEETQLEPVISESVFQKPKRKYTRRKKSDDDGEIRPKRRYRRRDMQAEE